MKGFFRGKLKGLMSVFRFVCFFIREIDSLDKRLLERKRWRRRKELKSYFFNIFKSRDHILRLKYEFKGERQVVTDRWKRWVKLGLVSFDGREIYLDNKMRRNFLLKRCKRDKNFRKEVVYFKNCLGKEYIRINRRGLESNWVEMSNIRFDSRDSFKMKEPYRWWKKKKGVKNTVYISKERFEYFLGIRSDIIRAFRVRHSKLVSRMGEFDMNYKGHLISRDSISSVNRYLKTCLLNGRELKEYKGSNVYFINKMLYDSILDTDRVRFKDDRFLDDDRLRQNSKDKGLDRMNNLVKFHNKMIYEDLCFKLCSIKGGNVVWWNSGGKRLVKSMLGDRSNLNNWFSRFRSGDFKVKVHDRLSSSMRSDKLVCLDRRFRMRNKRDVVRLFRIVQHRRLNMVSNMLKWSGSSRWINRHERRVLGSEGGRHLGLNVNQYDGFVQFIGGMKKEMDRHIGETRSGVLLNRLMVEYKRNQKLEIKGRLIMRRAMRAKTMRFGIHERIQKSNRKSIYVLNEITTFKGCTSVKIMIERQTYAHRLHEYNQKNFMAWLCLITRFTDFFYKYNMRLSKKLYLDNNNNGIKRELLLSEYVSKARVR